MELASEVATEVVRLKQHYKHDLDTVFNAWMDAEILGKWFGPHSHNCNIEKWEPVVGGQFQIRMKPVAEDHDCEGDSNGDSVCAGEFVEVEAGKTLAMTFNWIENGADIGDSLLTIEFSESNGGTDVTLSHERIPTKQLRKAHEGGWKGTLECLQEHLAQ